MKALSLWQPWASLMAVGAKRNETRHWLTGYRGELAIHAARKRDVELTEELAEIVCALLAQPGQQTAGEVFDALPFGCVVCVVDLHDIRTTEWESPRVSELERACGNYSPGRFAWRTVNCRGLKIPVPAVGRQGLFSLPPEVEAQVRARLEGTVPAAAASPNVQTELPMPEPRCRSCQRGDVRMGEVCGHCGDTNPLGVRELGMEEQA